MLQKRTASKDNDIFAHLWDGEKNGDVESLPSSLPVAMIPATVTAVMTSPCSDAWRNRGLGRGVFHRPDVSLTQM